MSFAYPGTSFSTREKLAIRLVACCAAVLLVAPTMASETVTYAVLAADGKHAGRHSIHRDETGLTSVEFLFKENGRGPELKESFRVAANGTFSEYRVKGSAESGAVVDEVFVRAGEIARWQTPFDRGEVTMPAHAMYAPLAGTPEVLSVLIAASRASGDRGLPLIPTGMLAVRRVAEIEVRAGSSRRLVQLLALEGLGFMPTLVWVNDESTPRVFARLVPAGFELIEQGWESSVPLLRAKQIEWENAAVAALHERLVHKLVGTMLIRNVRIFDSEHGSVNPARNVLISGGRITSIVPVDAQVEADNIVEGGGRVLLPGLFDMHSHVLPWEEGGLHLAAGVTTMRDMGSDNATLQKLMAEERAGRILWPHIVPAGLIEGDGPAALRRGFVVKDSSEAKAAVDWYATRGYPQIKIYNSFPKAIVREIAHYAHDKGLRVSGHVPASMRAQEAVESGFDEIQHINQVMLNFLADDTTDTRTLERFRLPAERTGELNFDGRQVQDFIALLARRGTVIDATLSTFEFLHQRNGEMWPVVASLADHLPPHVRRGRLAAEMDIPDDAAAQRYRRSFDKMVEFVGRAYRAGVPLVAGTDELAGFTLQHELELYVRTGLTPAQVLQIATWNGARYAGVLADRGSIEVGKRADLILCDGDPTVNISDLRRLRLVLKNGDAYYPSEIHAALNIKPFAEPLLVRAVETDN
jgi:hypothetical protein